MSCASGLTPWPARPTTESTPGARGSAPSTACADGSWPNTPSGWVCGAVSSLLDSDQQANLLLQRFDDVFGPDLRELEGRGWRRPPGVVRSALKYFERVCDEVINPRDLTRSRSAFIAAVGRCYRRYERLLLDENAVDFAHLQAWADLLLDDDDVAAEISGGVRYLMCDEYQDTSHVQERILRRLSAAHGNLCVVGDEDQSLYRFRGATVRNILGFARRFPDCRVVELTVNYRSHPDIVRAYDRWMGSADWSNPDPAGMPFRHAKTIVPHDPSGYDDYPAVIAVDGQGRRRRGQAAGCAAAVPEKPRGDRGLSPGGVAVAQRAGRGGRTLSGRSGRCGHSRPLRAGRLRPRENGAGGAPGKP